MSELEQHVRTAATGLWRWFVVQTLDAAAVGLLWLAGLLALGVPWAPLWALLAALFQYVPHLGPVLGVVGPALAAGLSSGAERALYVLILYAAIVLVDGLLLQPYLLRRTAKVPIWASILAPLVLGILIPFWGVLLAPPLLAVLYTFRSKARQGQVTAAASEPHKAGLDNSRTG